MSFRKTDKAFDLLKDYNGTNPYMLILQREIFAWRRTDSLDDFKVEFILRNYSKEPVTINKVVRIADWYGEKKQIDWQTEFVPEKIKIVSYLGDTESHYCCYVKYRQSVEPVLTFLPKKAVLTNFFARDYTKLLVDFDRYDRLSMNIDPNRRLREHQKTGVRFLLSRQKCILADDMGLGKSTTLSVAAIEGNFDSVLIICPASLKTNWKKELMWYVPERDITIVDGFNDKKKSELEEFLGYAIGKSGKKKEELLSEAKDKGKWVDNRFVIVNYDILEEFYEISRVRSEAQVAKLVENNPMLKYLYNRKSLIIIDEAHKLSNNTSSRYKIINDLIKRTNPYSIYLSTGTPVTNAPQNLYCLLKLLNDPIANDWEFFMERYCGAEKIFAPGEWARLSTVFFKKVGKSSFGELTSEEKDRCREFVNKYAKKITVAKEVTHIDDLKEAISHIYLRREKSDVTDLPVKTVHEVRYDLTETQRNEYERLWDEYEQATLTENPDKNLNKDLMEGSIYRIYLAEQMVEHTIELANKFIENGDKVVIACCYDNELYTLKDYYGDRCVIYNGKCSLKQKDAAIEKIKNDDNVKVFLGNIISAGVGITLINSHRLIFCSYDYVYANNSQMEDRIHRIGQTEKCDVYYQMFNDTHCEHMWDIVLKKQYLSDTLITSDGK